MTEIDPLEINKKYSEIEDLLGLIEKFFSNQAIILNFARSLNVISVNFQNFLDHSSHRQQLIDLQCNSQVFNGSLHEEYHENNMKLEADLDNLYLSYKTSLNRFASFFLLVLDKSDRRGIKNGSFGKLLNAVSDKVFLSPHLETARKVIVEDGRKIDETINFYRDKYIEHISTSQISSLVSNGSFGDTKKFHYYTETPPNDNNTLVEENSEVVKSVNSNGEYVYYVHCALNSQLLAEVKKGQPLGFVSDGQGGKSKHFLKWGPHSHMFSSPKLKIDSTHLPTSAVVSPEPVKALSDIACFYEKILVNILSKYSAT